MSDIYLSALRGANPLSAMAAFGLLRACSEMTERLGNVTLRWEQNPDWIAVLGTGKNDISSEELISNLVKRQERIARSYLLKGLARIGDIKKLTPKQFGEQAIEIRRHCKPQQRNIVDFIVSLGSEVGPRGTVSTSSFQMTSGQQQFLREIRTLVIKMVERPKRGNSPEDLFKEALFGPWKYADKQSPFGWDGSTEGIHALQAQSPTESGSRSVRAAVWLAFEALALYPTVAVGRRIYTGGMDFDQSAFSWPIWKPAISIDTVQSLVNSPLLIEPDPPLAILRKMGVAEVFRSRRTKTGGSSGNYRIFWQAEPCGV